MAFLQLSYDLTRNSTTRKRLCETAFYKNNSSAGRRSSIVDPKTLCYSNKSDDGDVWKIHFLLINVKDDIELHPNDEKPLFLLCPIEVELDNTPVFKAKPCEKKGTSHCICQQIPSTVI